MVARNGIWFLAVPVAFALVALGLSVESLPPGESSAMHSHIGRRPAFSPLQRFARWERNPAEPAVNLKIAATNAGPLVPITVSTMLSDARTFCVDVDLNHDGRFEGAGELAYATGKFEEAGIAELRLHGLIDGRYRARVRIDGINGETVSAVQRFELLAPRNSHLPMSFEVNKGQTDSSVLFQSRAKNQMVYVTRDETVLVTTTRRAELRKEPVDSLTSNSTTAAVQFVSRFRLAGANSWAQPTGQKRLPGKANYFIGNDPNKWRTDIDTFEELTTDVYPGIRMIHRSSQGRLAYDFRVAPGANPADITLDFSDAERLSLNDDGDLIVHHLVGEPIRHSAPLMYQEHRGIKQAVKGDWVLKGEKQAAFVIAAYDRGRELVIDPLVFSTYLGGTLDDRAYALAIDAAGNSYFSGRTTSIDFPITPGVYQNSFVGLDSSFVAKVDPTGSAVVYATYIGGGNGENAYSIAVDTAGNAYITGLSTNASFPTTPGAAQTVRGGGYAAYITKLDPAGATLVYSTLVGISSFGAGWSIAIDSIGNAYVTGDSGNDNLTTTPGVVVPTNGSGFITKLNAAGSSFLYASYLDDKAGNCFGSCIAVDAAGNAFVAGRTENQAFSTSPGAFQTTPPAPASKFIGFVTKFDPTCSTRLASTYLGGNDDSSANGLAIDVAGNIYVCGKTISTTFPTTPGAFQTSLKGPSDAFVAKLNPTLSGLTYSTFLGSSGDETVSGFAVDVAGNAHVSGTTDAADYPTTANATQKIKTGSPGDGVITKLDATGSSLLFSTYIGGSSSELVGSANTGFLGARSLAVDASGAMFVVGYTQSSNFPTSSPLQATRSGSWDIFLAKLTPNTPGPGVTIAESAGTTNVTEGGATDTYTVVLDAVPTANVTITVNPGTQATVVPATLTFTTVNWNVAQTVTVTAVDDPLVEGPHTGTITHTSASVDAAYSAIAIASVTANITDNDGVPPPTVPGGGLGEGNYPGSMGLGNGVGGEGTFGFGRDMIQLPRLKGPYRDPAGTFRVFNVAHQQQANTPDRPGGLGILGWSLMLLAVFVPAALVYGRRRPA